MRKSILKRIRFTKTGKMLRRGAGQNHFNAKESRRLQKRRGRGKPFNKSIRRQIINSLKK